VKFLRAAGIVLCIGAVLWGRAFYESRAELRQADEERSKGDIEEEIIHLDRAAHWYAPLNPYVGRALTRLWDIGQTIEPEDPSLALLAYDSIRGSVHAIRSLYWPHRNWLPRVNERIASLRADEQVKQQPELEYAQALEIHRHALLVDERPKTVWVVILEGAFLGWIAATVGLIVRGFDAEGRMQFRKSLPWIGAIVLLFGIWVVGLLYA
jgi:hypothetical protein